MQYQQGGSFEHEVAILKQLEGAADNHVTKIDLTAPTNRVAAMNLARINETKLPDSQQEAHAASSPI